jgi:hypothetical protein
MFDAGGEVRASSRRLKPDWWEKDPKLRYRSSSALEQLAENCFGGSRVRFSAKIRIQLPGPLLFH